MKKMVLIFALILMAFSPSTSYAEFVPSVLQEKIDRPTIAVIIGGQGAIRSNEKAITNVLESLDKKFPKALYELVTDEKLAQDILIFTEDEDVEDITQIKRSQLAKFGRENGYDYVVTLLFGLGHGRAGVDFWSAKYNIDVDLQAKVVDVATGKYAYRQNIMGHGTSSAAIGMPSSVNAFAKATKECVDTFCKEVEISTVKPPKAETSNQAAASTAEKLEED
ncbi:MAG: hypothetical protein E6X17_13285 [Sporomusaceae bacterium]|nr:hypothetical protein [Sporomusaceae bacterium]